MRDHREKRDRWVRGQRRGVRPSWGTLGAVLAILAGDVILPMLTWAEEGWATYYTVASCRREGTSGVYTASGERFDESAMTCAMRRRDWGTQFLIYGERSGRSVVVTLTDYGPGKKPTARGVIIDLTPTAFKEVCGDLSQGKCVVSVQEIQ